MKTYNYLNNPDFPIKISENTSRLTPYTFFDNLHMWEEDSLKCFFDNIPKDKSYNILYFQNICLYAIFMHLNPLLKHMIY